MKIYLLNTISGMFPIISRHRELLRAPHASPDEYSFGLVPFGPRSPPPVSQAVLIHQPTIVQDRATQGSPLRVLFPALEVRELPIDLSNFPSNDNTASLQSPTDHFLSDNTEIQPRSADQPKKQMESVEATTQTIGRPEVWFCHVCHDGPHNIHTAPGCTGMTPHGICGHRRCNQCTVERRQR